MADTLMEKNIKSALNLMYNLIGNIEQVKPGDDYKFKLMRNRKNVETLKDVIIPIRANISATDFKPIKARFDKALKKMEAITNDTAENNVDDVINYLTVESLAKYKDLSNLLTWKEAIYFINERLDQQTINELTNDEIITLYNATNVLSSCVKKEKTDMLIDAMVENFKTWFETSFVSPEARELILKYNINKIEKTYLSKYSKKEIIERITALNLLYQMR